MTTDQFPTISSACWINPKKRTKEHLLEGGTKRVSEVSFVKRESCEKMWS